MSKIAFIGTGVMGAPLAGHLVRAGHEVKAFNRSQDKCVKAATEYGFTAVDTIKDATRDAEVIFTMLGFPRDVEEMYLDPQEGLLANPRPGTLFIDLTTSSPRLAEIIAQEAAGKECLALDAPVSGGDKGAKEGKLVVMCGGSEEAFAAARPFLDIFGKEVTLLGSAGCGQHCKACNQIAVAGATAAYTEAMVYAKSVGIDPEKMFSVIAGGAAGSWQIENMAPRAMKGDIDPGFFIKHFIKDMNIALEEAKHCELQLPMTEQVRSLYRKMQTRGQEDLGTQALFLYYEESDV